MAKECRSKKKKSKTRKCFKCEKEGHITKDYKGIQSMKKQKIQVKLNNKEDKKKDQGFGDDLEQAWYKRSPIKIPRINILFQITEVAKERGN